MELRGEVSRDVLEPWRLWDEDRDLEECDEEGDCDRDGERALDLDSDRDGDALVRDEDEDRERVWERGLWC